jgi:predicted dehydrogenase
MAETAKPVRVGIIGLSASATTSWASTAHLPCFTCPSGQQRLQIVALCNSSVEAATSAIQSFNLPASSTKAYGDPSDLAADADVDLVICTTRVDKHYETTLPSIQAGKDVYIEWPIASNTSDIARLVQAAKKSGSTVLVGLQGRCAPPVMKVAELLDEGVVGKVLSSDVRAFGGSHDREVLPEGLAYFAQREVGGNVITIGVGHGESCAPFFSSSSFVKELASSSI